MSTSEDQGNRQPAARKRSVTRTTGGVALMLLGVALTAYGAHYVTKNGNCSGTGYTSYGPVPKCSGNEFLYITSAFFLGPAVAVVGWLLAQTSGLLWPLLCTGLGVGFITISNDANAATGAKAFGVFAGDCFFALAILSVIITLRKRHRKRTAPSGVTSPVVSPSRLVSAPAMSASPSPPARVAGAVTGSGSDPLDPLDTIAKLAQLRDSGALTDEEFEREKAKLLDEIWRWR